jgi:hypothetical protein
VQVPALHAALVLGAPTPAHARPHAPQFVALPSRLTSHPLVALLSQSAKPALHEIAQAPIAQRGVPLAELQVRPHAPQAVAVALRSVSQPLPALPSQSPKPALHARPQDPLAHAGPALAALGHEVTACVKPSSLHTCRAVIDAQLAAPGRQVCVAHTPSRHPVPAPHVMSLVPLPLAAQMRRVRASAQAALLGTHACGAQVRSAVQNCPMGQSTSPTQSAHTPRAVSHTWSKGLHCRDDMHGVGAATQLRSRHTVPVGQSGSETQSTQRPATVSHTCPGHMRDDTHAVAATH